MVSPEPLDSEVERYYNDFVSIEKSVCICSQNIDRQTTQAAIVSRHYTKMIQDKDNHDIATANWLLSSNSSFTSSACIVNLLWLFLSVLSFDIQTAWYFCDSQKDVITSNDKIRASRLDKVVQ